ncbi:hypothetical protein [Psychrobacter lutiphocae]|uniref:hypothetical protein n=1 Tax=Psychrobacter lutiphocae TaxID=540500 RepID=UPI000373DDC2|nr:hypothetical protein [Psychrobacter lutiphocae]
MLGLVPRRQPTNRASKKKIPPPRFKFKGGVSERKGSQSILSERNPPHASLDMREENK